MVLFLNWWWFIWLYSVILFKLFDCVLIGIKCDAFLLFLGDFWPLLIIICYQLLLLLIEFTSLFFVFHKSSYSFLLFLFILLRYSCFIILLVSLVLLLPLDVFFFLICLHHLFLLTNLFYLNLGWQLMEILALNVNKLSSSFHLLIRFMSYLRQSIICLLHILKYLTVTFQ